MRRIIWLTFGIAIGAFGMWAAMTYHILRTKDGVACVPKHQARLAGTFIDVREWGVTEWTEHPELVLTLQRNERTEIIGDMKMFDTTLRDAMNLVK